MSGNRRPALVLIVLLTLIHFSCGSHEPSEKTGAADSALPAVTPERQQMAALLPQDNAVSGWSSGEEPRFFNAGDLWEYIDGAAEGYLNFGFEEVVTAEYSHPEKPSQAVIDIYRLKDARNAFGIYTQELNPESDFRQIGVEGYIGGTALNFWAGPYYVKLTVFQESEDLKSEMVKLAENIAGKLGPAGEEPAEVRFFPPGNLLPHSIRYLPKDVLGQSYLSEAFEARYRADGGESKALVITLTSGDQAAEGLARYQQFISSSGTVDGQISSPADGGFTGKDSFYGIMAAVRSGNRLLISLGGPSREYAMSQIEAVLKNVP